MIRSSSAAPARRVFLLSSLALPLAACESGHESDPTGAPATTAAQGALRGRHAFEQALPGTNGRACATCHVLDEATTLRPESVEQRLHAWSDDPLFDRLDADDPAATSPTFEHLKKGLVRVILPLPDNVDVIDREGCVVTPSDRTIFVWRGVPTVANTVFTAPYQLDGRAATLSDQARSALLSHSAASEISEREVELIANFQRTLFSSERARFVADRLAAGIPETDIVDPERVFPLSPEAQRGREVYDAACRACHGGATTDRVAQPDVVAALFPELKPDGNVRFRTAPGVPPEPLRIARPGERFMNAGYGMITYFGQLGLTSPFNASVAMPRYRLRFYRDGTRHEALVDLPPVPVTASGDPQDPRPAMGEDGAPIVGPNLVPQLFTTDPGRAAVTGDPRDFEAFDVPQLRGIADTAPYFHDNSRETLRDVVDEYSRFLLPFLKTLRLSMHPPESPGGRPEALSPAEKSDLLAFLKVL